MMNEQQVADHLNMSVGVLRKWRLFRNGPKFLKIGRAVRYRRRDVEAWLDSCQGLSRMPKGRLEMLGRRATQRLPE